MSGHRPFGDLTKGFSPERTARIAVKAAVLREETTLDERRKSCGLSQEDGQPIVARIENRSLFRRQRDDQ